MCARDQEILILGACANGHLHVAKWILDTYPHALDATAVEELVSAALSHTHTSNVLDFLESIFGAERMISIARDCIKKEEVLYAATGGIRLYAPIDQWSPAVVSWCARRGNKPPLIMG